MDGFLKIKMQIEATTTKSVHISVMPKELIDAVCENKLQEKESLYFDCTMGGAGHTKLLLDANPQNRVVALDRDLRAVSRAKESLKDFNNRLEIHHANFSKIGEIAGERKFSGLIADLGISTDQLKEQRGFSFGDETPLDMRMDESQKLSVKDIVNELSFNELYKILKEGGVGNEAKRIADLIVKVRPILTTKELKDIVNKATQGFYKGDDKGQLALVFQSFRIAVNNELSEIKELLIQIPNIIKEKGRVAIISFHSLEDKLVTKTFRDWEQGDTTPAKYAVVNRQLPKGKILTKKAILPSEEEIAKNPSARSARLRIFEFN